MSYGQLLLKNITHCYQLISIFVYNLPLSSLYKLLLSEKIDFDKMIAIFTLNIDTNASLIYVYFDLDSRLRSHYAHGR